MSDEDYRRRMVHLDHGRSVETVLVECIACGKQKKAACPHSTPNDAIAKFHFKKWTIKGVNGAKMTLCPQHARTLANTRLTAGA
jgi:hypothetical protein